MADEDEGTGMAQAPQAPQAPWDRAQDTLGRLAEAIGGWTMQLAKDAAASGHMNGPDGWRHVDMAPPSTVGELFRDATRELAAAPVGLQPIWSNSGDAARVAQGREVVLRMVRELAAESGDKASAAGRLAADATDGGLPPRQLALLEYHRAMRDAAGVEAAAVRSYFDAYDWAGELLGAALGIVSNVDEPAGYDGPFRNQSDDWKAAARAFLDDLGTPTFRVATRQDTTDAVTLVASELSAMYEAGDRGTVQRLTARLRAAGFALPAQPYEREGAADAARAQ